MSILDSIFQKLQVLHQFYFSSFPLFYHRLHYPSIQTTLFHLCLYFFLFLFLFVSRIRHIVLHIVINWILKIGCLFLLLILTLKKVASCHNEVHTFLSRKLSTDFFKITSIYIIETRNQYLDNISLLNSILSGDKGQSLWNLRNSLGYSRSTSKIRPVEVLVLYLFKSSL